MAKHRSHSVAFKRSSGRLPRSSWAVRPRRSGEAARPVAEPIRICGEKYEAGALDEDAVAAQGVVANHMRIRQLMREHGLQPKRRQRFVATTDSNHDGPIFPDCAKGLIPTARDRLWVADLTYVVIPGASVTSR
jgi:putative transposase